MRRRAPLRPVPVKKAAPLVVHRCIDCALMRDLHGRDFSGQPFLCRCDHVKGGIYSHFTDDKACKYFTPR